MIDSILSVAEEFTFQYGIGVIPADGSKRPVVEEVIGRRRRVATHEELKDFFAPNGTKRAQYLAVLLDSPKPLIALDLDGTGLEIFEKKLRPKCSAALRVAVDTTMRTKTPRNGIHIILKIQHEDFPKGIHTKEYWNDIGNGKVHNQVNLMGKGYYLVERGPGYEPINGPECLVTLSKEEAVELLNVLEEFESETKALRKVSSILLKYYQPTNRQNITLRVAGYMHRHGIPEHLIFELIAHLIEVAGGDEESEKRYQAVRDTCVKDAGTDQVSGYAKLLEVVNGDDSVIVIIQKELGKLGYHFNGNCDARTGSESNDSELAEQEDKKQNTAAKLFELVEQNIEELFKDQLNNAFAAIKIDGHIETIPIASNGKFKMWICKTYYETKGELMANTDAISAVCNMLQAKAFFGKKMINLDVRISAGLREGNDNKMTIHYDLTNNDWEQVKITSDAWSIKKSTEVPSIFRRHTNHIPQVYPSRNYQPDIFDQFMKLINATVRDKDGNELANETYRLRLLLKCYIISLFIPHIPKAALMLHGDEGGAKSALQELIKSLVDPSIMLTLTFPQDSKELIQQLSHSYIAYYDNVNHKLPDWISDLLCRVVTGSGFSKRMLYTDDEDVIYNIIRCVGINGVNLAATRADLLDRSLIIRLSRLLKKHQRKLRDDIWPEFERMKSQLLGYIFDILVKVLAVKRNGGIHLEARSRMADWEEYAEIIARCMGYEDMEFINAYEENKNVKTETVLADSPVAQAILKLGESGDFRGTATQLLHELEPIAQELGTNTKGRTWPKSASALSRKLNSRLIYWSLEYKYTAS